MLFENPESFEYVYMEDRDSVLLQLEKDGIVMRQRERYFDYNEWDFGGPF
jgi:hypothetical protein